jgi:hypothetical protein
MNCEELDNYFMNNNAKLWSDKADIPGKCVRCLIDRGPGQTNKDMLAKLRLIGFVLFPAGPPFTTHLWQVMDQLFGYSKTIFFQNFKTLWNCCLGLPATHVKHEKITGNYIGMLVFGAELPDGELLHDAFAKAFPKDKIKSVSGEKIGVFPFTRKALGNKKIRHKNVQTKDGKADTDADPKAGCIKELNDMNSTCCEILNSFGYAGKLLKINLPICSGSNS